MKALFYQLVNKLQVIPNNLINIIDGQIGPCRVVWASGFLHVAMLGGLAGGVKIYPSNVRIPEKLITAFLIVIAPTNRPEIAKIYRVVFDLTAFTR